MRVWTPSTLAKEVQRLLGRSLQVVEVEGEISQIHVPASGHCYFQLRDRDAALSCVVWRTNWQSQRFHPRPGDRVVCRGRVGAFGQQSRYQLYVSLVRPAGEGKLAKELAARRARLESEGLLDPRRKRALPRYPRFVGIATSPTGAALQDFLRVSRGRWPAARILLGGCTVQGPTAPSSVLRAVELLLEDARSEVIVVTRGGGSKVDLLPFMDETLARFLAHSPVPIVSAVGHEIDTTLADLVADAVAPTPSAAAGLVFPDGAALASEVDARAMRLDRAMDRRVVTARRRLAELRGRLRDPLAMLRAARRRRHDLLGRLDRVVERRLAGRRERLRHLRARLEAVAPRRVLERGYAIVEGPRGVVRAPGDVAAGEAVRVRVAGGAFGAKVMTDESAP